MHLQLKEDEATFEEIGSFVDGPLLVLSGAHIGRGI